MYVGYYANICDFLPETHEYIFEALTNSFETTRTLRNLADRCLSRRTNWYIYLTEHENKNEQGKRKKLWRPAVPT